MPAPISELTNAKLLSLSEGLLSLDGIRTSQTEFRPFQFDTDTSWLIASNVIAVQDSLRAFERARKALAGAHGVQEKMPNTPENKERAEKFLAALDELTDKVVTVSALQSLSRKALNHGNGPKQNPIPPSVLAKLMPILTE